MTQAESPKRGTRTTSTTEAPVSQVDLSLQPLVIAEPTAKDAALVLAKKAGKVTKHGLGRVKKAVVRPEVAGALSAAGIFFGLYEGHQKTNQLEKFPNYAYSIDAPQNSLTSALSDLAYIPQTIDSDGEFTEPMYPDPGSANDHVESAMRYFPEGSSIHGQLAEIADELPNQALPQEIVSINGETFLMTSLFEPEKTEITHTLQEIEIFAETPEVRAEIHSLNELQDARDNFDLLALGSTVAGLGSALWGAKEYGSKKSSGTSHQS